MLIQSRLLAGENYSLLRLNIQIILIGDVEHTPVLSLVMNHEQLEE